MPIPVPAIGPRKVCKTRFHMTEEMLCLGPLCLQVVGKGLHGEHHLCFEIELFYEVVEGSLVAWSLVLYQSHQRLLVLPFLALSLHCLCDTLQMGWLTMERGKIKWLCKFPSFSSSSSGPHPCKRKV